MSAGVPETTGTELVKFGKYKGQPVAVMLEDRSYCEWLSAQDWLREERQPLPDHHQLRRAAPGLP